MSIRIVSPGVLATIQDDGRNGCRAFGIGPGGAMDRFAMTLSNYLCGNNGTEAVIEIHFPAPGILFEQNAVIGLAGADLDAFVDESSLPAFTTLFIKKGSVLKFRKPVRGARAYLAVQGGWEAERWWGSYSTHLKLGLAGHQGRALQKGDRIDFKPATLLFEKNKIVQQILQQQLAGIYQPSDTIRCIQGAEYALLDEKSTLNFERYVFTIHHQSDRMGYRLNSRPLFLQQPAELLSSPVDQGIVQLLPDGNCIVLMADHQTTGGYPRIASVIKADLPKLAQAKPGDQINFKLVSLKEAEEQFIQLIQTMDEIKNQCDLHLKNYLQA